MAHCHPGTGQINESSFLPGGEYQLCIHPALHHSLACSLPRATTQDADIQPKIMTHRLHVKHARLNIHRDKNEWLRTRRDKETVEGRTFLLDITRLLCCNLWLDSGGNRSGFAGTFKPHR